MINNYKVSYLRVDHVIVYASVTIHLEEMHFDLGSAIYICHEDKWQIYACIACDCTNGSIGGW